MFNPKRSVLRHGVHPPRGDGRDHPDHCGYRGTDRHGNAGGPDGGTGPPVDARISGSHLANRGASGQGSDGAILLRRSRRRRRFLRRWHGVELADRIRRRITGGIGGGLRAACWRPCDRHPSGVAVVSLTRRARAGVALVELIVAIALLTLLVAATLRSSLALGRQSVAVAEHAAVQAGVRTGMLLARAELRELGSGFTGADLLRLDTDSITFRAARGFGVTCAMAASRSGSSTARRCGSVDFARRRPVATVSSCSSKAIPRRHSMIDGSSCRCCRSARRPAPGPRPSLLERST